MKPYAWISLALLLVACAMSGLFTLWLPDDAPADAPPSGEAKARPPAPALAPQTVRAPTTTPPSSPSPSAKLTLPPIHLEAAERQAAAKQARGIYQFAQAHPVGWHPGNAGIWTTLPDGRERWELTLVSPNALSLNFAFQPYHMPAGGELVLLDEDGHQPWRAFTAQDNEEHGQLWTPLIGGAAATLRLTLPPNRRDTLALALASVNQGFRGWKKPGEAKIGGDTSGACNIDVVCDANDLATIGPLIAPFRDQIRSVGAYTLNGIDTCSGALIANTGRNPTPYFLTADHCGINRGNAASIVCYWNFENSTCRVPNQAASGSTGDGPLTQFNSGAIFRAGYVPSDMTLIEFDDPLDMSHNLFLSGWDRSGVVTTRATAIHHPSVSEKRISFDLQSSSITDYFGTSSPGDNTHIRIADWDHGTTEGGSSGSPLFDQNKRIVGQLHGGDAACGNDDADWYGRLFTSWTGGGTPGTRLKDWLDPGNAGPSTLDGYFTDESLAIGDVTVLEGSAGTTFAAVPVTLTPAANEQVTVLLQSVNGTATSPSDYTGFTAVPLVFLPGQTQLMVQVAIIGDGMAEETESFSLQLLNPVNAAIADPIAIVTIQNDDFQIPPAINSPLTGSALANQAYTYQITAQNSPTTFGVANAPAGMSIDASSGIISWPLPVAGRHTIGLSASNPAGSDQETLTLTVAPDTILTAIDNEVLTLLPGSDWFLQSQRTHDGLDAARSGGIGHSQTSSLTLVINGPDELAFWWSVSSEQGYDVLQLSLNGVLKNQLSGDVDWIPASITIPTGTHTASFHYVKDTSVSVGEDAGFVDELLLASQSDAPFITGESAASGFRGIPFQLALGATGMPSEFSATNLPPGLGIDNQGLISGIPETPGVYNATIVAENDTGWGNRQITITIFSPVEDGADTSGLSWSVIGASPWFTQSDISHDSVDAVQSGTIRDNEMSQMSVSVRGPGTLSWWWQVSSETTYDELQVALDGITLSNRSLSGAVSWRQELLDIPPGIHLVSWTYRKDQSLSVGADAGWVDEVLLTTTSDQLGEALDAPALTWMTGGDTTWFAQTATTRDGTDAAQSGSIGHGQDSWMQTEVEGPGLVRFHWQMDAGNGDSLGFMLNGQNQTKLSRSAPWQTIEFPLIAGRNSLRWDFVRSATGSSGANAAWVDKVQLLGYAGWVDQALGANAAADADPNGNGIPNLTEYAVQGSPVLAVSNGYFTAHINKPSWEVIGVTYQFELSDKLIQPNWSTSDAVILENTPARFRARDRHPIGNSPQRFYRVRIEASP